MGTRGVHDSSDWSLPFPISRLSVILCALPTIFRAIDLAFVPRIAASGPDIPYFAWNSDNMTRPRFTERSKLVATRRSFGVVAMGQLSIITRHCGSLVSNSKLVDLVEAVVGLSNPPSILSPGVAGFIGQKDIYWRGRRRGGLGRKEPRSES